MVLRSGTPLVWFDRRGHHLVTFPESTDDASWADALVELVKDGRARSIEVRKVDGEPVGDAVAAVLRAAGFVDGYRGLVVRG